MTGGNSRALRAILRNALTWGAAWAVAGGALVAAFTLFDPPPGIGSLPERLGLALFAAASWGVSRLAAPISSFGPYFDLHQSGFCASAAFDRPRARTAKAVRGPILTLFTKRLRRLCDGCLRA